MTPQQQSAPGRGIDTNTILIGGVVIGGLFLGKKILEAIGLLETPEDKADKELNTKVSESEYTKPTYYKELQKTLPKGYAVMLFKQSSADALAKQLEGAAGFFNDDEDAVYGAIRQVKYKSQFSFLADRFYKLYKKDLWNYLAGFLGADELAIVSRHLEGLKKGIAKL